MPDEREILICPECEQHTLVFKTILRKTTYDSAYGSTIPTPKLEPEYEQYECSNCFHTQLYTIDPRL